MRFVHFGCKVSGRTVEDLLTTLQAPGPPRGVLVNSPGGEFEFFSTLAPAVQGRGLTMVAKRVNSAAIILFLLGNRRIALPGSTFFFHEVWALIQGCKMTICRLDQVLEYEKQLAGQNRELVEEWRVKMRNAQHWYINFVSRCTGIRGPVFLDLMRQEAVLTAKEARRYGIVHEIMSARQLRAL